MVGMMGILGLDGRGGSAGGTVLIAHTAIQGGAGANTTTNPIDTTGANLLIMWTSFDLGIVGGTEAVSDSNLNTWTGLTRQNSPLGNGGRLWYSNTTASPTVGSGHTFSMVNANAFPCICVAAFKQAVTSPLDQQNGAAGTSTAPAAGSITPGANTELIVSGVSFGAETAGVDISGVPAGFSLTDDLAVILNTSYGGALAWLKQGSGSGTPINPTWTLNASKAWTCTTGSFKGT